MKHFPRKRDLNKGWAKTLKEASEWELICEENYIQFANTHKTFKDIPFHSLIFKLIWVKCLQQYCK